MQTDTAEPLRIISLGAGVQSTTMLLMSLYGELPRVEHAIFADTQDEPAEVYRHLDKLETECVKYGVTLHRVTKGRLSEFLFGGYRGKPEGFCHLPTMGTRGGMGNRACTVDFKISPIRAKVQELRGKRKCELWIGISLDEVHRMKESQVGYIVNLWPLVDRRMSRHDCIRWLAAKGWSAVKSSCTYCPFHGTAEWRRVKGMPEEWAKVIEIDRQLNKRGEYLHRSLKPIDQVDFTTEEERGQMSLFGNECEGVCGV